MSKKGEAFYNRIETLAIFGSTDAGTDTRISFQSDDDENMTILAEGKNIALVTMGDFLELCERALEIWGKKG